MSPMATRRLPLSAFMAFIAAASPRPPQPMTPMRMISLPAACALKAIGSAAELRRKPRREIGSLWFMCMNHLHASHEGIRHSWLGPCRFVVTEGCEKYAAVAVSVRLHLGFTCSGDGAHGVGEDGFCVSVRGHGFCSQCREEMRPTWFFSKISLHESRRYRAVINLCRLRCRH